MAETESEAVSTSGFKVRPLSKVAKADSSPAATQKAESSRQKAESSSPKSHDSEIQRKRSRLRELTEELRKVEAKLRLGGGPDKIEKQHKAHKLTARERIELLLDKDFYKQEVGLLVAYDQYLASGQWAVGSGQKA
jgi:small-conductance mechanosensitive channel